MTTSDQGHAARNGRGRFVRTVDTAARDAEACRLRTLGLTYEQIASQLGFSDRSNARSAVERGLVAIVAEPAEELRTLELARLDELTQRAWGILDDEPPGVALQAIDRILKIQERRAKLLGLDAPTRVEAQVQETTQQDIELQELIAEARARQATAEAQIRNEAK